MNNFARNLLKGDMNIFHIIPDLWRDETFDSASTHELPSLNELLKVGHHDTFIWSMEGSTP